MLLRDIVWKSSWYGWWCQDHATCTTIVLLAVATWRPRRPQQIEQNANSTWIEATRTNVLTSSHIEEVIDKSFGLSWMNIDYHDGYRRRGWRWSTEKRLRKKERAEKLRGGRERIMYSEGSNSDCDRGERRKEGTGTLGQQGALNFQSHGSEILPGKEVFSPSAFWTSKLESGRAEFWLCGK